MREAEAETREALEPFGYYSPQIDVQRARGDDTTAVTITVVPGAPVRVRDAHVAIEGEGGSDRYLKQDLDASPPGPARCSTTPSTRPARPASPAAWPSAATSMPTSRSAGSRSPAPTTPPTSTWSGPAASATTWAAITFDQQPTHIIRDDLLDKLVYWEEGSYYHQGKLDRLRESLVGLDYFSRIDIEPQPEDAVDHRVPVQVTLTPAKRSIYTAGVSYGTDSGAGVRLGVERRYLNSRGHKALAQVDYAQRRKTLTLQYRIPAFAWLDGWYTASLQAADEQTDYIDTRRVEFVASRSGEINSHLTAVASLHALRERWAYAGRRRRIRELPLCNVHVSRRCAPSTSTPTTGCIRATASAASLELRGGVEGAGSDASFAQLHARAQLVPRPGRARPPDRARRTRPHLHRRTGRHAAEPALLRRRRPQHPRLQLPRSRPAHPGDLRPRRVRARRQERDHRQRRVRALLHRAAGAWRCSSTAAARSTAACPTGAPASASACAGARRWGRCASTSAAASTDPDSAFTVHLNIGADL